MKITMNMKAEATDGKGRTFNRVYTGLNPYKENGVSISKGRAFGLRRDNKGPVLVMDGRDIAISPITYDSLMKSSKASSNI